MQVQGQHRRTTSCRPKRARVDAASRRSLLQGGAAVRQTPVAGRCSVSSPTGAIVTSLAPSAMRSPHLRPHCDVRQAAVFAAVLSMPRPGPIDAPAICSRVVRRSYASWVIGTSFGTLRAFVARSRSFCEPASRQDVADLQVFPAMARPGLEPGTPRFSVVRPAHLNSLDLQEIPWLLAQPGRSALSRTLRSFPGGLRQTAAPVCLFAGPATPAHGAGG
jgi:hypothetical protein